MRVFVYSRRLVLGLLLMTTSRVNATTVEDIELGRARFFVDLACFADSNSNRLELYYKIFNDGLNYVKKAGKYVANYEVNVLVLGDKEKQITGKSIERNYVLDDYAYTKSQEGFLINQLSLNLEPGSYQLVCKLIDHNSNNVSTIEARMESFDFDRGADISGIEFVQEVPDSAAEQPFLKGEFSTVPVVERTIDAERQKLGFYVDIYASDYVGKDLTLEYAVAGRHTAEDLGREDVTPPADGILPIKRFFDLGHFLPGEYELILRLKHQGKQVAERHARFPIKWSLSSLVKNDFEYAIGQLKYILEKEDREKLEDLPDSERVQAFDDWWKSKDPTPDTPENELRDEYYRRIRYANQYYSTINREGWLTDRGMVYIKYGEPDQVDRHPFELDRKPYQVWYYYGQRRTFVFVDSRGDGDFQLSYPYDGDWRKYMGP